MALSINELWINATNAASKVFLYANVRLILYHTVLNVITKHTVEFRLEVDGDLDKVQAAAMAVVNKVKDPQKDLDTGYTKEKIKEKFD